MREPKFSDAPCFGKEFEQNSKICRVCLANKPCQRKFFSSLGARQPPLDVPNALVALRSAPGLVGVRLGRD
jgi:hypothetical protein